MGFIDNICSAISIGMIFAYSGLFSCFIYLQVKKLHINMLNGISKA